MNSFGLYVECVSVFNYCFFTINVILFLQDFSNFDFGMFRYVAELILPYGAVVSSVVVGRVGIFNWLCVLMYLMWGWVNQ